MQRVLLALLFALVAFPAYAQQWDVVNGGLSAQSGPTGPLVIINQTNTSTNNKILSLRANGTEKCSVDVDGDLVCAGSFSFTNVTFTGQAIGPLDTDCSAPAYSGLGKLTTGFAVRTAPSAAICVNGTLILLSTASAVTSSVDVAIGTSPAAAGTIRLPNAGTARWMNNAGTGNVGMGLSGSDVFRWDLGTTYPQTYQFFTAASTGLEVSANNTITLGGDVSLSRGAANRLDLASGDSLYVVSGGLGVGTIETDAGQISSTSHITSTGGSVEAAASFIVSGRWIAASGGATGLANLTNAAGSAGIGLDFSTDAILKVRNRAQDADATLTALALTATQSTTDTTVQTLQSTATNDDPVEAVRQYRVTTADATPTALATVTITTDYTTTIKCVVTSRRTGGVAGSANDGAAYDFAVVMKNTAGTAAEIAAETVTVIGESQGGWNVTAAPTGATEVISVTGAVDNNVTWHATCRMYQVSS